MSRDLTYVNSLLLRFGIYVYDHNEENKLALMKLELQQLYQYQMITKEEYLESLSIIRSRQK